jgi:hypothetical protein
MGLNYLLIHSEVVPLTVLGEILGVEANRESRLGKHGARLAPPPLSNLYRTGFAPCIIPALSSKLRVFARDGSITRLWTNMAYILICW